MAPTGGVQPGSVPSSRDAGYSGYPAAGNVDIEPGVVGNGVVMGSGVYSGAGGGMGHGAGGGAVYGAGGPGPTPYRLALSGVNQGGVLPYMNI